MCGLRLVLVSVSAFMAGVAVAAGPRLETSDVSFLWPAPETRQDVERLIGINEPLTESGLPICSQQVFDQILEHAAAVRLNDAGEEVGIDFHHPGLKEIRNWKIAGVRIDPSAPGCSSRVRIDQNHGSTPQIRLVIQPVTLQGDTAESHDFAMHLVFSYVTNRTRPFTPDKDRFAKVVKGLVAIKTALADASVVTTGVKLGVHPGFASPDINLTNLLREFLKTHLTAERLVAVAFMGVQDEAEPWIFFAASKSASGDFVPVTNHPSLGGSAAQMLSFVTSSTVFPIPTNHQFGAGKGVATESLFSPRNPNRAALPGAMEPDLAGIQVSHVADIIANPDVTHFFTTDCVSCHTESALRVSRLNSQMSEFAYKLPAGISGADPDRLPKSQGFQNWNVRNFGWGFLGFRRMVPTVTWRTANESAESAHFINTEYLAEASEPATGGTAAAATAAHEREMVANALTLIMNCKSDDHYEQLQAKIKALLARDDNPINHALDELGNVHFARFVFLEEHKQVAVITSYDGDFEAYIRRFSEKIGDVFNLILEHVEGTDSMRGSDGKVRVQEHLPEFLEYIRKRDLSAVKPFYSAYPDLTVQRIRQLKRAAEQADHP